MVEHYYAMLTRGLTAGDESVINEALQYLLKNPDPETLKTVLSGCARNVYFQEVRDSKITDLLAESARDVIGIDKIRKAAKRLAGTAIKDDAELNAIKAAPQADNDENIIRALEMALSL